MEETWELAVVSGHKEEVLKYDQGKSNSYLYNGACEIFFLGEQIRTLLETSYDKPKQTVRINNFNTRQFLIVDIPSQEQAFFLAFNYITSVHRLNNWIEAISASKDLELSPVWRKFRARWLKPVRELRDVLEHFERYVIKGGGRRPENMKGEYAIGEKKDDDGEKVAGIFFNADSPNSYSYIQKVVYGEDKDGPVFLLGGKLDFFELHRSLSETIVDQNEYQENSGAKKQTGKYLG